MLNITVLPDLGKVSINDDDFSWANSVKTLLNASNVFVVLLGRTSGTLGEFTDSSIKILF